MDRNGIDLMERVGVGWGRRQCLVVTNGYFLKVYSRMECRGGKMSPTPLLMKVMPVYL